MVVGKSDGSSVLRSYEDFGGGESVVGVSEGMHGSSSSVDDGVRSADATTSVLLDIVEVNVCSVLVTVIVVVVVVVMAMSSSSSQSACSVLPYTLLGSSLACILGRECEWSVFSAVVVIAVSSLG